MSTPRITLAFESLQLPEGYRLLPIGTPMGHIRENGRMRLIPLDRAQDKETVPPYALYGGATITMQQDAAGQPFMGCDARDPNGDFYFHVFGKIAGTVKNIPLQQRATGRGGIWVSLYDGRMYWQGWEHDVFYWGSVPEAQPFAITGSAAYVPIQPNAYNPQYDGGQVSGGRMLDMAALFGVPPSCRAYNVRLVAQSGAADTRARLGTETQPGQLTANTQAANVQIHTVGIVNADDAGRVFLSVAPEGRSANVWLTVAGYWP